MLVRAVNVALNEALTEHLVRGVYPRAVSGYPQLILFANKLLDVVGQERVTRAYFAQGPLWIEQEFDSQVKETGAFARLSEQADKAYVAVTETK